MGVCRCRTVSSGAGEYEQFTWARDITCWVVTSCATTYETALAGAGHLLLPKHITSRREHPKAWVFAGAGLYLQVPAGTSSLRVDASRTLTYVSKCRHTPAGAAIHKTTLAGALHLLLQKHITSCREHPKALVFAGAGLYLQVPASTSTLQVDASRTLTYVSKVPPFTRPPSQVPFIFCSQNTSHLVESTPKHGCLQVPDCICRCRRV